MKNPQSLIEYWKKEKLIVFLIFVTGIGFNGCAVFAPVFQGRLVDAVVMGKSLEDVIKAGAIFAFATAAIQITRFFKRFFVRLFANKTAAVMRYTVYRNIINRDLRDLKGESSGNLTTRAIGDVDLAVEGMRKVTTEVFDTGVLMLSYLVSLFIYDWKITLFSTAFIPLAMLIAEKLKTLIYKYTKEYRQQNSKCANIVYNHMGNITLIRESGIEDNNLQEYKRELEILRKKAVRANIFENAMPAVYNVIAMCGVVWVIVSGGANVAEKVWTIGDFSAYLTIFAAMGVKASKAAKLFNTAQKAKISWLRVEPYLESPPERLKIELKGSREGKLEVQQLSFGYEDKKIINDITFFGEKGEIIGVTGPIASGKSTLGIILLGIYPYEGSIRLDGMELRDYKKEELTELISYQGHKAQLLNASIYENITLGDMGNVEKVLKTVCLDSDVKAMKDGIETKVGSSGARLSGGQQSRLALARALYRERELIVLDDPFSAVDMGTEARIIENIRSEYKDSCIVIISHRLSIFPFTDRIVLLDSEGYGKIGTHEELFEGSREYRRLYELQSKGEKDE